MSRIQNLTMNRGEWSEAYALLSLIGNTNFILSDKSLADQNTNQYKVNSIVIPAEAPNKFVSLSVQNNYVIANYEGRNNSIPVSDVKGIATRLFQQIQTSTSTTFSFNQLDSLWNAFFNPQIKATRSEKSDIKLEIFDLATQSKAIKGFSIKSNLGGATSLLNASQSTNFLYEAPSKISITELTPKNLGKFVKSLPLKHLGSVNQTYKQNLQRVDQNLESLISHLLVEYYGASNREKYIKDILAIVAGKNSLNFSNIGNYQQIISKFLTATAFGMVPRDLWNGALSANGGMIIVKDNGKLACFYLDDSQSNANLNSYLLENSFFDTASTTRHDFGKVFDDKYFKFNLLIRL
jgi:hypothetical protein